MPRAPELPLVLNPQGLRVLIVGGGKVARRKLQSLPRGLEVRVVAPSILPGIHRQGCLRIRRKVRMADLDQADIVFVTTNDPALNAKLARGALAKRKLISVADAPEKGNFSLPAVAKAGLLRISVSSSGASPAISKALRQWLQARLRGSKLVALARSLGRRRAWLKKNPQAKRALLMPLKDPKTFSDLLR
jgi:precorrin-2 dehydrogenase/sirohydrochlorin ferrochelatase